MSSLSQQVRPAYLREVTADLVRLNSVNPSLVEGGAGEGAVASYLADAMRAVGLEVEIHEAAPGRPNVVGRLRGRGGGRSLMLNGHMDTVGVAGMKEPFSAHQVDGRLYGRGAQDMKGSLAAMLAAADALVQSSANLRGDLILAAVCDEEAGSLGTEALLRHVRTDAAVVTEPTDLTLSLAHRGFIWYTVETIGRAAHGSRYREGVDAIMRMGRVLSELEKLERALRGREGHILTGPPSLHTPDIRGGSAPSVYAARCELQIERRTVPGETVATATAELEAILESLRAADPTFVASVRPTFDRAPFATSPDTAFVGAAAAALTSATGQAPAITGQSYWTDAALLSAAGIETVVFGPRGGGLHSDVEWVDMESVRQLAVALAQLTLSFAG